MFRLNLWTRPFLHPGAAPPGMDSSAYLSNPLTSQALMVLASSAAEAGREGSGTHPAQGHPLAGEKENHQAVFPGGAFPLFRPGEHLPPPLYPHLHQPFLGRSHLDPSALGLFSPRGASTFHSLPEDRDSSYPSAFVPAAKKLKLDMSLHSERDGDGGDIRTASRLSDVDASSPRATTSTPIMSPDACHSSSPALSHVDSPVDLRSAETMDRHSPTGSNRSGRWSGSDQGLHCPICKAGLQPGEVQSHLIKEMEDLRALLSKSTLAADKSDRKESVSYDIASLANSRDVTSKSRYDTFLRIKCNRETRLAKIRGRRRRYTEELHSPASSSLVMTSHLDCQRDTQEDETIDVIGYDDQEKENGWNSLHKDNTDSENRHTPNNREESRVRDNSSLDNKESTGCDAGKVNNCLAERIKCSVCMEPYNSPVTSVQCWHVHCEQCWLQALTTKNCCPQCNMVTSPSDLRRIYI